MQPCGRYFDNQSGGLSLGSGECEVHEVGEVGRGCREEGLGLVYAEFGAREEEGRAGPY